ncbi:MAG: hypothetical protein ACKOB4_18005, partial [Acidobacteriota bacterium]
TTIPAGRASLFTRYVRSLLEREVTSENILFNLDTGLLDLDDTTRLSNKQWRHPFDLPNSGPLFEKLSSLAFWMQDTDFSAHKSPQWSLSRLLELFSHNKESH